VSDAGRREITVQLTFSEAEAQRIAQAIRAGKGHGALLQGLVGAYRALDPASAAPVLRGEDEVFEERGRGARPGGHGRHGAGHRRRLRGWLIPALAAWARQNADAFARAAADPAAGVTVTAKLSGVPQPQAGGGQGGGRTPAPRISISIAPGARAP
jgi:hypothetical protein